MKQKKLLGIFPDQTAEQISLLKYSKTSCGVDFLLNTADSSEKRGWFDIDKRYKTDFFEFYFFRRAKGSLLLNGKKIYLHDSMVLIVSPYQQQEWHVRIEELEYTFLVFQEEFINQFLSDKLFMYRLLYCFQNDYPTSFDMQSEEMEQYLIPLRLIRQELRTPIADSYHLIKDFLHPGRFPLLAMQRSVSRPDLPEPGTGVCPLRKD